MISRTEDDELVSDSGIRCRFSGGTELESAGILMAKSFERGKEKQADRDRGMEA